LLGLIILIERCEVELFSIFSTWWGPHYFLPSYLFMLDVV